MLTYSPGATVVHLVDARVKLLWLFFLLGLLFSARTFETAVLALLLAAGSCALARISPFALFPKPRFLLFILAAPLLFGVIFMSFEYGAANSAILLSAISFSLLFVMTTEQRSIVSALRFFRVPASISFSLSMALGFLPVFERKLLSVRVAQASRGRSSRNPISLVVPFMHSVMKTARNLSVSMDARAFDPERIPKTSELKMRALDWLALALLGVAIIIKLGA
jgi:energy-coupling factor transporter transmembrane protein EcfT